MALQIRPTRLEGASGVSVVRLEGELDASNYVRLIDEGRRLYATGTRRVVLDLGALSFLASSGLIAFHSLIRIMRGQEPPDPDEGWGAIYALESDMSGGPQQDVLLAAPQPAVDRVLERTGLKRLFPIHPDRDAAIASL